MATDITNYTPNTLKSHSFIDNEIDQCNLRITFEYDQKGSGKFNFERISQEIKKLVMFMLRKQGLSDHEIADLKEIEVYVKVNEIKGTYNTWVQLTVNILCSAATIIGGAFTLAGGIGGATSMVDSTVKWLNGAGQFGTALGQGGQNFGMMARDKNEAIRTVWSTVMELDKGKLSGGKQSEQEAKAAKDRAKNDLAQEEAARHSLWTEMTRGVAAG